MITAKVAKIIAQLMRPRLVKRAEDLTIGERIRAAAYNGYTHVAIDYVDKEQRKELEELGYTVEDRDYYFVVDWSSAQLCEKDGVK